jgi:hypothetical protein
MKLTTTTTTTTTTAKTDVTTTATDEIWSASKQENRNDANGTRHARPFYVLPCLNLPRPLGVDRPRGGQLAAVFYFLGYHTPYVYGLEYSTEVTQNLGLSGFIQINKT